VSSSENEPKMKKGPGMIYVVLKVPCMERLSLLVTDRLLKALPPSGQKAAHVRSWGVLEA
jgi:hypothetical protein